MQAALLQVSRLLLLLVLKVLVLLQAVRLCLLDILLVHKGTQIRLANFLVQRPTVHFIDALSKFRPQMIDVAMKFMLNMFQSCAARCRWNR